MFKLFLILSVAYIVQGIDLKPNFKIEDGSTIGCKKLTGPSKIPLIEKDVCDATPRDACGIISPESKCYATAFDLDVKDHDDFLFHCQAKCSASKPPGGIKGVLNCQKNADEKKCFCPKGTKSSWSCGVCGSPPDTACFCCSE